MAIKPKAFRNPVLTEQFVRNLDVPDGYWQRLLSRHPALGFDPNASDEGRISQLLIQGVLRVYPVSHLDKQSGENSTTSSFPTIRAEKGLSYKLVPASVLLEKPVSNIKTFSNKDQAVSFLGKLNLDDDQLTGLAQSIDMPKVNWRQNPGKQITVIAQALLDKNWRC